MKSFSGAPYYPERVEVLWGTQPTQEALTNVLVEATVVSTQSPEYRQDAEPPCWATTWLRPLTACTT